MISDPYFTDIYSFSDLWSSLQTMGIAKSLLWLTSRGVEHLTPHAQQSANTIALHPMQYFDKKNTIGAAIFW